MEITQRSQKILYTLNFIFKTYPEKFYTDLSSNSVKNPLPVIKCVSEQASNSRSGMTRTVNTA
jgi:hypothetical protein